eukprot:gene27207-biopygen7396
MKPLIAFTHRDEVECSGMGAKWYGGIEPGSAGFE